MSKNDDSSARLMKDILNQYKMHQDNVNLDLIKQATEIQ